MRYEKKVQKYITSSSSSSYHIRNYFRYKIAGRNNTERPTLTNRL